MKAMILAAGRGERMRPLTDTTPKPLLEVRGKPLIQYHIQALADSGYREIVINHAWLGEKIEEALGDGSQFDVHIEYSREGTALETGGGIYRALPLLGDEPFLVVNGDIYTNYTFKNLRNSICENTLLHVVLIPNPPHNPKGDFALQDGKALASGEPRFTFSGIAAYHPAFFSSCRSGSYPLAPLLRQAMNDTQASGELFEGDWTDVGTPNRLEELNLE